MTRRYYNYAAPKRYYDIFSHKLLAHTCLRMSKLLAENSFTQDTQKQLLLV